MSAEAKIMTFPVKSPYQCDTAEPYTSCKLPKGMPDDWKEARKEAYHRFWDQGLPSSKLERFKYANIAKAVKQWDGVLEKTSFEVSDSEYITGLTEALEAQDWVGAMLVRDPPGLEQYADTALWDLNSAYVRDGIVIDIPSNTKVEAPITLRITAQDDTYTSARLIVRLGQGAELTLIETQDGSGEYWKNHAMQVELGSNAKFHHYRLQKDSQEAVYTQNTHVRADRDAAYDQFTLTMGAGLSRNQIHGDIIGAGADISVNGINLLNGKQVGDTTILVEHQAPHATSNQFMRSLIDESARGVFQGKVHVHQVAQKTDGYQLSNALLLSPLAEMDTKPELEIYADDVKCSHGATTGQLDEEPLFYLRQRGLSEAQARLLMITAFVEEVIEKIEDEGFAGQISQECETWLTQALSKA